MAVARTANDISQLLPPQNLDAERSVLGSMLLSNEVIDDIADVIQPPHFYSHAHRRIAEVVFRLYEESAGGVDTVTVAEELQKQNALDEIGGFTYLAEVVETVPHAVHARHYAQIVRNKSLLRSLKEACTKILENVYSETVPVPDILNSAEEKIFSILELKGDAKNLEIGDILMETLDELNQRWLHKGKLPGVSTGFVDLDKQTNGLRPAELVILAARPSMGKTAFVCNMTLAVARDALKEHSESEDSSMLVPGGVMFFSLEQSKLELAERFLCILGKLDGHRLKQGDFEEEEKQQVLRTASTLGELPIFLDDQPGRSMAEISAISRRMKRRHDIGLIIIDYLQLIEPEEKNAPREQQVAQITRRLKHLAKEIHVPVIALAQLNRGVELRENKLPRLADLRESGAIEQDADLVMFLHREDAYGDTDRQGEADLVVAKHRNGPTGIVPLTWIKESMRFENSSRDSNAEKGVMAADGF